MNCRYPEWYLALGRWNGTHVAVTLTSFATECTKMHRFKSEIFLVAKSSAHTGFTGCHNISRSTDVTSVIHDLVSAKGKTKEVLIALF